MIVAAAAAEWWVQNPLVDQLRRRTAKRIAAASQSKSSKSAKPQVRDPVQCRGHESRAACEQRMRQQGAQYGEAAQ